MPDRPAPLQEIIDLTSRPDLVTYCGMVNRVGIGGFATEVEFTYFKPDTEANDLFQFIIMTWPKDFTIPWLVMTMPIEYEERVSALLWKHGLRISDGADSPEGKGKFTFMMFDKDGQHVFPLIGRNVKCLENHSKGAPNVAYTNDQKKIKLAFEHEAMRSEEFRAEHLKWLNTAEGRKEARAYWAKHPELYGLEPEPEYTGPEIPDEEEKPRW